jgi:hypothetical protein
MSSVARKIKVTVEESEIIVTDPKMDWRVSCRHSTGVNGLVAVQVVTDRAAKVSERSKFLAEAFRKASEAGAEGWLACLKLAHLFTCQ